MRAKTPTSVPERLDDAAIRAALHLELYRAYTRAGGEFVVRDELPILTGAARIDIAVMNGHFEGFEIKSDVDTFLRFAGQKRAYHQCFEKLWLVTTSRHAAAARRNAPATWGIKLATGTPQGIRFRTLRSPAIRRQLCKKAILQFLRKDELLTLLPTSMRREASREPKFRLFGKIAAACSLMLIKQAALRMLKSRPDWRDQTPLPPNGARLQSGAR